MLMRNSVACLLLLSPFVAAAQDDILINAKDDGYRGIWYFNQPSGDEYVYKYSGGLGTYCANHIPHAIYAAEVDKTFFVYGGTTRDANDHLMHMVSYYDHKAGVVPRPTILLDKQTSDAHDNPVLSIDDAGYLWVFSSSHGTSRPSYISKSRKPYDIDAFDLVYTGNYSYPQPWHLPGKGFLFLHTIYKQGRTVCMTTSADGLAWAETRLLAHIDEGHYQVSRPFKQEKVGTSFMYHPQGKGLNWRTNLYYMETRDFGATWRNVKGETLALPLRDVRNPALAHEYASEGLLVYIMDVNYDAAGNPVVLYITSKGYEAGPENMPRTWTTARWTGTTWDIRGQIVSDNNYDTGFLDIDADGSWRIMGPTETGPQPYNPGGEVALWTSTDRGTTWTLTRRMTQDSERNHTFVRSPLDAHPGFFAFWADGHGRRPSESRLYFADKAGNVYRLPWKMEGEFARPEPVTP